MAWRAVWEKEPDEDCLPSCRYPDISVPQCCLGSRRAVQSQEPAVGFARGEPADDLDWAAHARLFVASDGKDVPQWTGEDREASAVECEVTSPVHRQAAARPEPQPHGEKESDLELYDVSLAGSAAPRGHRVRRALHAEPLPRAVMLVDDLVREARASPGPQNDAGPCGFPQQHGLPEWTQPEPPVSHAAESRPWPFRPTRRVIGVPVPRSRRESKTDRPCSRS